MKLSRFDHIVLCVNDVQQTIDFYEKVLGMEAREERPFKYSLYFGRSKISLQDARTAPDIARDTIPGSGNFCLLTETPISEVVERLARFDVSITAGPGERDGATGTILSVYFRDPDGNLVEISNQITQNPAPAP